MDIVTHALSGVMLASLMPETTPEQKAIIIIGSILPDIPFSRAYFLIAKKAKKSIFKLSFADFDAYGPAVKSKIKSYLFFHSFVFLAILFIVGFLINKFFIFLGLGWGLHLFYDLFLHKYEKKELRPRPFYPLNKSWDIGLTNGWMLKPKHFMLIWFNHLVIIAILTIK